MIEDHLMTPPVSQIASGAPDPIQLGARKMGGNLGSVGTRETAHCAISHGAGVRFRTNCAIPEGQLGRPSQGPARAQVIVAILETPVTHSGKTYPLCGPAEHSFAEVAEIASRVLGTQITYQQASVDTFAESIGQTGNALFKEHCRAVAVELQEGVFAGTNSLAAQISGRPPMRIEEFVAKNRAAFV
jgi:hypothetical protein